MVKNYLSVLGLSGKPTSDEIDIAYTKKVRDLKALNLEADKFDSQLATINEAYDKVSKGIYTERKAGNYHRGGGSYKRRDGQGYGYDQGNYNYEYEYQNDRQKSRFGGFFDWSFLGGFSDFWNSFNSDDRKTNNHIVVSHVDLESFYSSGEIVVNHKGEKYTFRATTVEDEYMVKINGEIVKIKPVYIGASERLTLNGENFVVNYTVLNNKLCVSFPRKAANIGFFGSKIMPGLKISNIKQLLSINSPVSLKNMGFLTENGHGVRDGLILTFKN